MKDGVGYGKRCAFGLQRTKDLHADFLGPVLPFPRRRVAAFPVGGHDVDFDALFPLKPEYRRPEGKASCMAEANQVFSADFLKGLGHELGEEEYAAPPRCPGSFAGRTCLHVNTQAITKHIKNIYEGGELVEAATCSKMEQVRREGNRIVNRKVAFYNLDLVIAVGYRVNSKKATAFRIWATNILREYIIKGFAMDDERLKNPDNFLGEDYFDEMLERIKDIRSSERRFYQQITDIYSQCSVDYDKNSPITRRFFAQVQNELHWAISKKTAAEIICSRAVRGRQL